MFIYDSESPQKIKKTQMTQAQKDRSKEDANEKEYDDHLAEPSWTFSRNDG